LKGGTADLSERERKNERAIYDTIKTDKYSPTWLELEKPGEVSKGPERKTEVPGSN